MQYEFSGLKKLHEAVVSIIDVDFFLFRINSFTPDMVAYDVRNTIIQAFNHWARYTPLRFQEQHQGIADIMIMFASRYHGDGNSFDGPGMSQFRDNYFIIIYMFCREGLIKESIPS